MIIRCFSKALFSTWLYYGPDRLLFDAGEGVASFLAGKVFAIERIFLTHGHADHIAGLYSLVNIRNLGMGNNEKPLEIYYPEGNDYVEKYRDFLLTVFSSLRFELTWRELNAGERLLLKEGKSDRFITAFRVAHEPGVMSLGYQIVEERNKLLPHYVALKDEELQNLIRREGIAALTRREEHKILTITGDAFTVDRDIIDGTDLLIHEATFLRKEDRGEDIHASVEEIFEALREVRVKELILYHISTRYGSEVNSLIEGLIKEFKITIPVHVVIPGKLFER